MSRHPEHEMSMRFRDIWIWRNGIMPAHRPNVAWSSLEPGTCCPARPSDRQPLPPILVAISAPNSGADTIYVSKRAQTAFTGQGTTCFHVDGPLSPTASA